VGVAVTTLVDRAIDASGLSAVLSARRGGDAAALDTLAAFAAFAAVHAAALRGADLLALGALADVVRREEVGDEVRIYVPPPGPDAGATDPAAVFPRGDEELTGLELLREVAIARVTGPRGGRVRVDWSRCGLELAQVALGFGADELAGHIASKRGVLIGEGELLGVGKKSRLELATVTKRRELAGFVRRAGRAPVFVLADGTVEAAAAADTVASPEEGARAQEAP
jgi:hypothetical protein